MTKQIDQLVEKIESIDLLNTIRQASCSNINCDNNKTVIHTNCLLQDETLKLPKPSCTFSLTYLIIVIMSKSPTKIDDAVKEAFAKYFQDHGSPCKGLINSTFLTILSQSKQQTLTWLKYEVLLIHLINSNLYESKTMASEILSTTKSELAPETATKFSSVINSCVKHCRKASSSNQDEEEEEKWCEIIDWLSCFIAPEDGPF